MSETTHPEIANARPSSEPALCPPNSQTRTVLCCYFEGFLAAIAQRDHQAYQGKAVVIAAQASRTVVLSCSAEAIQQGIRPGMPLALARQRYPPLIALPGDPASSARIASDIREYIAQQATLVEQAALNQFYLDLSGMDRFLSSWRWAQELQAQLRKNTGLPLSIGLSTTKLVASIGATQSGLGNARYIPQGQERPFLSPLAVRQLPGVGQCVSQRLAFMGIQQIGPLSQIPPQLLAAEFGKKAYKLWANANAIDPSPVVPFQRPKQRYEAITFPSDTIDLPLLQTSLQELVCRLALSLRSNQQVCSKISLHLQYTDGSTYTKGCKVAPTALEDDLAPKAIALLSALFTRRQRIRLIGLTLGELHAGQAQLDLFQQVHPPIGLANQ